MKINFTKLMLILFALLAGVHGKPQNPQHTKGDLTVVVTGIKNNSGQIGFYLYNSSNYFPDHFEKAILSAFVPVAGNAVEYTFTHVEPGTYAVAIFHDADHNKILNTNFMGIPKEGIGFSNNAKGHFGPPKYDDAKINYPGAERTIVISLKYL